MRTTKRRTNKTTSYVYIYAKCVWFLKGFRKWAHGLLFGVRKRTAAITSLSPLAISTHGKGLYSFQAQLPSASAAVRPKKSRQPGSSLQVWPFVQRKSGSITQAVSVLIGYPRLTYKVFHISVSVFAIIPTVSTSSSSLPSLFL